MADPTVGGPTALGPYWRRAFGLPGTVDPAAARRAVAILTPWLGRTLARAPVAAEVPEEPTVDVPEAAFRRLVQARQSATLAALRARGMGVLPIKGHAAARLYEPQWVRILGDLDLLVRPGDAAAVAEALAALGFLVERSPQGTLGVTSDVSFHPMVSPDGLVSVDLHTALDAYPLSAALDAEAVFADADVDHAGPASHHAAVAAISNLAKERFAPYALRHLVDLGRLAVREEVDWPAVDRVVVAAGLGPARSTALGTLRLLGVPESRLPPSLRRATVPAARLAAMLDTGELWDPGRLAKAGREPYWCYAPGSLARLWLFRIAGLLRPRSGLPPGIAR